jgi:hypothetical protein
MRIKKGDVLIDKMHLDNEIIEILNVDNESNYTTYKSTNRGYATMSTDLFVAWLEDWFRHATEDERLAYLV